MIFDYEKIIDRADFIDRGYPDEPPLGIRYVIINGGIALDNCSIVRGKKYGKLIKC